MADPRIDGVPIPPAINPIARPKGVPVDIPPTGSGGFPTPKGFWHIVNKRKNPTWVNPEPTGWGKSMPASIPPGPGNPLGPRAIEYLVRFVKKRLGYTPAIGDIYKGRPA